MRWLADLLPNFFPVHVHLGRSGDAQPNRLAFDREDRDRSFAVRHHNSLSAPLAGRAVNEDRRQGSPDELVGHTPPQQPLEAAPTVRGQGDKVARLCLGLDAGKLHLKLELLQHSGSFKARGAFAQEREADVMVEVGRIARRGHVAEIIGGVPWKRTGSST